MPTCGVLLPYVSRIALGATLATTAILGTALGQDKPTGAPLVLSSIETEQEVPLAILLPDSKTAKCVSIRLHWNSRPDVGPNDDAASFTLDLPPDNPAAPIFTAQLWNASLASALAWQEPWEGARWKVLQTPVTDGTGFDAALAVGMIATSARRPYPPKTVVIGSLNPDGSLGPVSHLVERINAAVDAGMTRVIIPSVQRFDADASGQVVNIVRHAQDLHLECVPVDDLVAATEGTMNDPLPDVALDSSVPRYSNDVATYIDDFAHREQTEAIAGLRFAPKESDLSTYPPRLAAIWKSAYADVEAGQQAYRAGQVYVAYELFTRANGHMNGANALAGQTRITFDVKSALAESSDLHDHLQVLMNPPSIDQGGLESAVLVAEMADWAYNINASLEGAQLVTKQAFSQRSDATEAEKDRAREAILFSNEQCKYLLTQADFYTGLLAHISKGDPLTVEENAAHLLPQLIPAQLATARGFTDGIRASDLRNGLLFDPRLVAYVNVLREVKADWDAHQHNQEIQGQTPPDAPAPGAAPKPDDAAVKLNANAPPSAVGFDPGDTFKPPHTMVAPATKKVTDAALCLIWVNHDCEIATLDEKYLRLSGTMDVSTHDWRVKDRAKLDSLLQMAEVGARHGIAFAEKANVDPSLLAMIYEKAAHERIEGDDASALDSLRNYWRCALLGNVCWQLAHTPKAQPVDLSAESSANGGPPDKKDTTKDGKKTDATDVTKTDDKARKGDTPTASTNTVVVVPAPGGPATTNEVVTPSTPPAVTNLETAAKPPPETSATNVVANPTPLPVTPQAEVATEPPVAPIAPNNATGPAASAPAPNTVVAVNPPVAPIASHDVAAPVAPPSATNTAVAVDPPVAPIATNFVDQPQAPPATAVSPTNSVPNPAPPPSTPAPAPVVAVSDDTNAVNIPVAPIAKAEDYAGPDTATNAAPANVPIRPSEKPDNADGHSGAFP